MKSFVLVLFVICMFSVCLAAHAGVSTIEEYGTRSTGEQIYKITCTNGKTLRYYWRNGEWYRAGLGVAVMSSYSLKELAKNKCQ